MHHTGINPTTTQWLHMPPLVLATAGCSPPLVFEDADRSTSRIFDGVSSHAQPWRLLAAGSQRGRRRGLLGLLVDGRADDAPRGLLDRERRALVRLPLDDDVVGAEFYNSPAVDAVAREPLLDRRADAERRRGGRGRRRRRDALRFSGWCGDDAPRGLLERERRALVRLPLDDDVVGACVWLGYRVDGVEWRIYPHHAIAASRRPQ